MNPKDDYYTVTIGHPLFYAYAANKNGPLGVAQSVLSGKKSGFTLLGFNIPWLGGNRLTRRAKRPRKGGRRARPSRKQ